MSITSTTFVLAINTENAAFDGGMHHEVARILRATAKKLERGTMPAGNLHDTNGNTVGKYGFGPDAIQERRDK